MEVWMSGEVMSDVADSYREARKDVERRFNNHFSTRDFGQSLKTLTFIGIIRPEGDKDYPEIIKYHKRDRDAEFRLKINHRSFRKSDATGQRILVAQALLRAIEGVADLRIPNFDAGAFAQSYRGAFQDSGWLKEA